MSDAFDAPFEPDQVEVAEWELERNRLAEIDVSRLRKMVDDFRDGTEPGRIVGQKCRAYYDDKQFDHQMLAALKKSRQPKIVRNEIKPAINGLVGVVRQAKVDPKAYPRNPDNEEQSDVASKALRYVADRNRLHTIKVDLALNHFIEGAFGTVVELDEQGEVVISKVRYDEMIYDPRSREANFSDARYKGIGKWMYEGDIRNMYPDIAEDISGAFSSSWADFGLGQMYADKPDSMLGDRWMDKKARRLFIVELHHREDVWMRSVFFVGGVLENGPSPYEDEYGNPVSNLVFQSCFIDDENQRYGQVAPMLSTQDELNAYASRALHLANSRQLQAIPGEVPEVSARIASGEAAKADGVIPMGWGVVPTADLFQGIQIMMADARQALVRQAPTPGILAEAGAKDQSGRSRLVLQQAGMTEIALAFGRLEDWENELYRMIWRVLKQFKRDPWWVRITGDDGKPAFVGLNMPEPMQGENGAPVIDMMTGQPAMRIANNLAEMDVDIEVETIPDTANLQAEQFETIASMLPLLAQAKGPQAAFMVGLALSSFPDKQRIKELVDAPSDDPEAQQAAMAQQQAQAQQQEIAVRDAMAKIAETESKVALNEAKTEQTQASIVTDAAKTMAALSKPVDAPAER